jgi:hypothetical protein
MKRFNMSHLNNGSLNCGTRKPMFHPSRKPMRSLVPAAMVLTLAGVCLAPLAFAGVALNTIEPLAVVTDNGRHIILTGPIACTTSEKAFLQVTVTQRATGAVAKGRTRIICTGYTQHWEVHASIDGNATFQEGAATAVAVGLTSLHRQPTDAHQWLVDITLIEE